MNYQKYLMNYFQGPPKYQAGGPTLDPGSIDMIEYLNSPEIRGRFKMMYKRLNPKASEKKLEKYADQEIAKRIESVNSLKEVYKFSPQIETSLGYYSPGPHEYTIDPKLSGTKRFLVGEHEKYHGMNRAIQTPEEKALYYSLSSGEDLKESYKFAKSLDWKDEYDVPYEERANEAGARLWELRSLANKYNIIPKGRNATKEDIQSLLQYTPKDPEEAEIFKQNKEDLKIFLNPQSDQEFLDSTTELWNSFVEAGNKGDKNATTAEQGGNAYILNKNNKLMNRNYNFQDGGLLGSLAGKVSSTLNANTMGSTFGAFGGAGQKYKELLGGTGLEPKPLLDWTTAEPQYRSKITKDLKWDRENQGWMDANGNSVSNEEITAKAKELYEQDKQRNQTITEGLPMSTQFGALFALNQAEQDELANKKSSLSDYPAVKSTYAPSGFEQGGQANDYSNLLSLFSDGGGTQQGGRVQQMMGYKEGSPYANEPYQVFNTDTITMNGVNRQILGIPNVGNPVLMQPNSGLYRFNNADYVTEIPMSRNGGMYVDGIEQAQFGKFIKGLGRTISDYGRGSLDFLGNTTGLFDLSNEKYKTKFGKKFAGTADKWARGIGSVGRLAANIALPGSGTALSMLGKAINPNGLGNKGQQAMGADTSQMGSGQQNPFAGLGLLFGNNPGGMGGAGGGLGSLLGGLGGSGGGGLGALLGFGEDGGKVQYNRLNSLFQDGGQTQPMPPQAQPQQEQTEVPQEENRLMQLPIEQQVELYKGLVDFVAQNGIDALEEQYPEEYEFFEAFSDFLEDSEDADGEEEDNQMPERMANGGIPQRYKNMGFSKVGQKKSSDRPGKKWMVLAKKGDKYKVVHGGAKGMSDFTKHRNEKRRQRFWDRMGGTQSAKAKDPFSPLYWHKRFGTW